MAITQQRILLSSKEADRFLITINRTDSVSFDLNEPIVCKSNQRIYLSLETFSFANAAFNVPVGNNTLSFQVGSGAIQTITITQGQYTTPEDFRSAIQAALTAVSAPITLSYEARRNVMHFVNTSTTLAITIFKTGHLADLLGITVDISIGATASDKAPRQLDLSNGRTVNFSIKNLDFDNLDSSGGKTLSSILATVPINVPYGSIESYVAPYDMRCKVNTKSISSLDVSIINLNNEPFDFGGLRWSATILVHIE